MDLSIMAFTGPLWPSVCPLWPYGQTEVNRLLFLMNVCTAFENKIF